MTRRLKQIVTAWLLISGISTYHVRATDLSWVGPTGTQASFNDMNNWNPAYTPSVDYLDNCTINNGGIAIVDSAASAQSIGLGLDDGLSGTLIIGSGQTLNASITVGNSGGTGNLIIQSGATLNGGINSDTVAPGSAGVVIDGTGVSPTTVKLNAYNPNESTLRIIGPNAQFSTSGFFFSYAPGWVYTPEITGTSHSVITYDTSGDFPYMNLGGVIRPEFSHGFVPSLGDSWPLVQWPTTGFIFPPSISVSLDASAAALPAGLGLTLTYPTVGDFNQVLLSVVAMALPGDFNSDGKVDGADFAIWQADFPKTADATLAQGDGDGDGDVDGADFVLWQTHYSPSPGTAAVPEPTSFLFAIIGGTILIGRQARRGRLLPGDQMEPA